MEQGEPARCPCRGILASHLADVHSAITTTGLAIGTISPDTAGAHISAGLLSVVSFPLAAGGRHPSDNRTLSLARTAEPGGALETDDAAPSRVLISMYARYLCIAGPAFAARSRSKVLQRFGWAVHELTCREHRLITVEV